jgi:ABC-type transport system involved in cytochrome c biogenesis permease subunit
MTAWSRFALGATGLAYGGLGLCALATTPMTVMIFDDPAKSTKKLGSWFLAVGYIGFGPTCLLSSWDLMHASKRISIRPKAKVPVIAIITPVVYAVLYVGVGILLDEETRKKLLKPKPKQQREP